MMNTNKADAIATASRAIGRILEDLEVKTGARVGGLALEELDVITEPQPHTRLSVRIELQKAKQRVWEIG